MIDLKSPEAYLNRELSWLGFARRVLATAADSEVPLLERVKFAGIVGMLHDEFFMKRMSGLRRQVEKGSRKLGPDGLRPDEELDACRRELLSQRDELEAIFTDEIRPAMAEIGAPILDHETLGPAERKRIRSYFRRSVQPILTPLAVDPEHPFPFISNQGLNLAAFVPLDGDQTRFVRIKVPGNRPRWVPLTKGRGFVPLEQVIAANLDLMFPGSSPESIYAFRVTRGAEGDPERADLSLDEAVRAPGSIVRQVSGELKARRFAGVVRLEVDRRMPKRDVKWLATQLGVRKDDVYPTGGLLGAAALGELELGRRGSLRYPPHEPATHPRLAALDARDPRAIFAEIDRGDLLLHHPYHSYDTSVLRFIESAAADLKVLAIKLTIYRTSSDSPTVRALIEAARRGKQVAVVVEITARFDEAPNIAWGQHLEREGVHVAYGVERLKTHVKLALVLREEADGVRRYVHVGTGNYHSGTARIYEDLGILTSDPEICEDVGTVFNSLTGAMSHDAYRKMIVAPGAMRRRFTRLIRREAEHAAAGRPSGITTKMNQLQDPAIIRELYRAGRAGVPIDLIVRGLCCLRPGVEGLSESIRVFGVVGRFLEHSRVYRFENGGDPEYYLGSADWMKRNLDHRVETVMPVLDEVVRRELDAVLEEYSLDNVSTWDCGPDGSYRRRRSAAGEGRRSVQDRLIVRARGTVWRHGSNHAGRKPLRNLG